MLDIINEKVQNIISNIELDKSLIVIKGIDTTVYSTVNLSNLFNKSLTKNWLEFISSNSKIISYEEFLYFYQFIVEEFDDVYIINNNIYNNFYPLYSNLSLEDKKQLADFFDHDNNDNEISAIPIHDGEKYTKIYSNLKNINDSFWVRYNDEVELLNIKVHVINLFNNDNKELIINELTDGSYLEKVIYIQ